MCSVPVYKMSFLLSLLSRDWLSALSLGWQDVLKQRKRPLLGRPPLWYLLPLRG